MKTTKQDNLIKTMMIIKTIYYKYTFLKNMVIMNLFRELNIIIY